MASAPWDGPQKSGRAKRPRRTCAESGLFFADARLLHPFGDRRGAFRLRLLGLPVMRSHSEGASLAFATRAAGSSALPPREDFLGPFPRLLAAVADLLGVDLIGARGSAGIFGMVILGMVTVASSASPKGFATPRAVGVMSSAAAGSGLFRRRRAARR